MDYNLTRNFKGYFCRYQDRCVYWKNGTCFFEHFDQHTNENNAEAQTNEAVKRFLEQITVICGNLIQHVNDKFDAQGEVIEENLEAIQEKFSEKMDQCTFVINEKIEQIDIKIANLVDTTNDQINRSENVLEEIKTKID